MIWVRDGGGNEPTNLIALCPNCHSLHTHGHIPDQAVRVWKGMLLSLNSVNRSNLDTLLHPKSAGKEVKGAVSTNNHRLFRRLGFHLVGEAPKSPKIAVGPMNIERN